MTQHPNQCFQFILWNFLLPFIRNDDSKRVQMKFVSESTLCLRMAVGISKIWLNIQDWCSIHQICSRHPQNHPIFWMFLNCFQLYRGKSNRVRTKWRSSSKYSHSCVSSKLWRPHCRRPVFPHCFGKLPDQPQVGEIFQSTQRLWISVLWFKDDKRLQIFHQSALSRNSKLGRKIAMYPCDNLYFKHLCHIMLPPSAASDLAL